MAHRSDRPVVHRLPGLFCVLAGLGAATLSVSALDGGAAAQEAGLFTPEQAERGRALYEEACGTCHGRTLRGSETGPPVVGAGFVLAWEGRTAAELLDYVSAEMPPESRGGLTDEDYVDVVAYLLQENGYPAGGEELTPASPRLEETRITLDPSQDAP